MLTTAAILVGLFTHWTTARAGQIDTSAGRLAVVGALGAVVYNDADGLPVVTLAPGEAVTIHARDDAGSWFYLETEQGRVGWAPAAAIIAIHVNTLPVDKPQVAPVEKSAATPMPTETAAPPPRTDDQPPALAARVVLTDTRLNVRSGPGLDYAVVDKLVPGSRPALVARAGEWVQVQLGPDEPLGWVSRHYLAVDGDVTTLPSAADAPPGDARSATPSAGPQMSPAGIEGKLVLQQEIGGPIYLYVPGNGRMTLLTHGVDPALSPDGQQVAFTRDGGENGLYVIDIDAAGNGINERLIFGERPHLRAAKWSPDGSSILFVRGDEFLDCYQLSDGRCMEPEWIRANKPFLDLGDLPKRKERKFKLARVNVDGSGYRDLPSMATAQAPDWSGGAIVYQSRAGLQILAADADAPGLNDLLYFDILKQYHQDPDWQPGGGVIVFQQREASHWEIFAVNPDGSGRRALTRPTTALVDTLPSNVAPAWSPDGRWIAFLSNRTEAQDAGPWRVWIMRPDGSDQQPLPVDLPFAYGFAAEQMVDWGP